MTPGGTRLALGAFALLSSGLVANLFMLQAPGRGAPWSSVTQTGSTARADAPPAPVWSQQLAERSASPAAVAPPLSGDSAELTRAVQRELNAKGYDTGVVDGVPGLVTRAAIMAYEADHGLALTGEAREALLQNILLGGSLAPAGAAAREEPGPRAQALIRAVQRALQGQGYAPGAIDGRMSTDTARAIRQFEAKQGMRESGRISGPLLARLARVAGQSALAENP